MNENIKDKLSHIASHIPTEEEENKLINFIQQKKNERSESELQRDRIISFRMNLLSYLENDNEQKTVGYFLIEYLKAINIKKRDFAQQLNIHYTKLSNILHDRVNINNEIAFKLEVHSKISAYYWIKIKQKQELYALLQTKELKQKAYQNVYSSVTMKAMEPPTDYGIDK